VRCTSFLRCQIYLLQILGCYAPFKLHSNLVAENIFVIPTLVSSTKRQSRRIFVERALISIIRGAEHRNISSHNKDIFDFFTSIPDKIQYYFFFNFKGPLASPSGGGVIPPGMGAVLLFSGEL